MRFLELSLMVEERRRLHEEDRECGHGDVVKIVLGVGTAARIRQLSTHRSKLFDEGVRHEFHAAKLYQNMTKSISST